MARRPLAGWISLVLAALAMVATLPGRTQGLGLVSAPLLDDLHLDQLRFAGINLAATLIGAAFALPAGWLIDRAGVRLAVPLFELALGATVLAMAGVHDVWPLIVLLTLTRGLGQTALSVGSLSTVGKWFPDRVSSAMGIYALIVGFGFIGAFPGVQKAAEVYGWRAAWTGVGSALLALAVVSALLIRSGPGRDTPDLEPRDLHSHTLREALTTPAFWVYGLTCALYLLIASGTGLFTQQMLHERGLGADTFRLALATTALVGIVANFAGGLIGARVPLPRLLAFSTLLLAPCLALFPLLRTPLHAIAWAAGLGAAGGIVTVVFFAIWARMFGPAHLGKIQGVAQALTVLGSAVGPLLFAASAEHGGSYTPVFLGLTPVVIVAAAACLLVKPPRNA
jgi:MFS family permease